jgi:large subunit ribosomal protein L22
MEVKAQHKNARMSARKVRQLREVVVGLPVTEAEAQLEYLPGKASDLILGVLKSAIANATHNFEIEKEALRVADVVVDEGLTMKRFQPVSRGMAHAINKRMSHVTVIVEETGEAKGEIRPGKKSKAAIETITAQELLKQGEKEMESEGLEDNQKEEAKVPAKANRTSASERAFQKKKMQQLGGDRSKTHRRKSLKGD